jgi:hypothetical protein
LVVTHAVFNLLVALHEYRQALHRGLLRPHSNHDAALWMSYAIMVTAEVLSVVSKTMYVPDAALETVILRALFLVMLDAVPLYEAGADVQEEPTRRAGSCGISRIKRKRLRWS